MRKIINWILITLSVIICLLLAGAYISRLISPSDFWPVSFLGLVFPILLISAIILLVVLILNKNKFSVIILIVILIGWVPIKESIRILPHANPTGNNEGIRIMSYNVRVFDNFKWSGKENSGQMLLDFVVDEQPDIICFQEFMVKTNGDFGLQNISRKLKHTPYKHTKYIYEGIRTKVGLAIFSRYPIINTGGEYLAGKDQMYIYADIKIDDDTIRLFNNHLESNHLSQKQINLIDSLITSSPKEKKNEYLGIIKNMKSAYINRAGQAVQIHEEISKSPYRVIVSGDFNDTPVSFSYNTISKGLKDAFVVSGKGMGATYRGFLLPLRIDYLLHDPSILSSDFKTYDIDFSDHHPIQATFWLDDLKGESR